MLPLASVQWLKSSLHHELSIQETPKYLDVGVHQEEYYP